MVRSCHRGSSRQVLWGVEEERRGDCCQGWAWWPASMVDWDKERGDEDDSKLGCWLSGGIEKVDWWWVLMMWGGSWLVLLDWLGDESRQKRGVGSSSAQTGGGLNSLVGGSGEKVSSGGGKIWPVLHSTRHKQVWIWDRRIDPFNIWVGFSFLCLTYLIRLTCLIFWLNRVR